MAVKRSQFLEVDVLFAIIILIAGVVLIKNFFIQPLENPQVNKYAYDTVTLLNTMPMGSLDPDFLQQLRDEGVVFSENELVSRNLARLVIDDKEDLARDLAMEATKGFIPGGFGYRVSFVSGDSIVRLHEKNDIGVDPSFVSSSRVLLTGLQIDEPVSGYTGSILLMDAATERSSYYYLGGFIGQGDITVRMELPENDEFTQFHLEGGFQSSFDLSVNGNHCYTHSVELTGDAPVSFINAEDCIVHLEFGWNNISIDFLTDVLEDQFISGGFIKVSYITVLPFPRSTYERKYLPDIDGVFNLYDSIYVPGRIENMNIFLKYEANYSETDTPIFFSIADQRIISGGDSEGIEEITITNDELSDVLNFADLEEKTIPFRFGFENITQEIIAGKFVDVSVITDLSGSMDWNFTHNREGEQRLFNDRSACETNEMMFHPSTRRIDVAKCILYDFIDEIIDIPENRIGLIGFSTGTDEILDLTGEINVLKEEVDGYDANGWTCIACGIYDAIEQLKDSPEDRKRVMLVMSDGEANRCDPRVQYTSTCSTSNTDIREARAIQQTIDLAEQAYNEHNISIYAIAFLEEGSATMRAVANKDQNFAVDHDGDHVRVSADNSFNVPEGTVSFWVKPRSCEEDHLRVFEKGEWDESGYRMRWHSNCELEQSVYDQEGNDIRGPGVSLELGEWHHITMVFGDSLLRTYVNGILEAEDTGVVGGAGLSEDDLFIGSRFGGEEGFFDGVIDEFRVWSKTLNENEISSLYNDNAELEDGLVLRYDFNNLQGGLVLDISGHGNHGEIVGAEITGNGTYGDALSLRGMAVPDNYFLGLDPEELAEVYAEIARNIIEAAGYESQVITLNVSELESRLFGDSYIEYTYTPYEFPEETGRLIITGESPRFGISSCSPQYSFPSYLYPIDGRITSYSGRHWTDRLEVNNELVYDLSEFGDRYSYLGDPFMIGIPHGLLTNNNYFELNTGDYPGDSRGCSPNNRLIYTASMQSSFRLDDIYADAEGCTWTVQMPDRTETFVIPSDYTGTNTCSYQSSGISYNSDDAWQALAYKMFSSFDTNDDGILNIDFEEQNLDFNMRFIDDIPYMWEPSVLEVVVWQ